MAKCTVYGCVIVAVSYIVCSSHCLAEDDKDATRNNNNNNKKSTQQNSFFKEKLKSISNRSKEITEQVNKPQLNMPLFFEEDYTDTDFVTLENLLQLMQKYPEFNALSWGGESQELDKLNEKENLNSRELLSEKLNSRQTEKVNSSEMGKVNSSDTGMLNTSETGMLNEMLNQAPKELPLPDNNKHNQFQENYGTINQNLGNLFENDEKIQNQMINVSKITDNMQEYILNLTRFDKEFKQSLVESEIKVANKTGDLVIMMKYMHSALVQMLENQQRKNELLERKLAAMENNSSVPSFQNVNKDYKVTKSTCNAQRRHLIKNSCYYIPKVQTENQLYSWWDSRYHCKEILGEKADLCIIETKQEMDDLQDMLKYHFADIDEFWIGATNQKTKTRWQWVNGVPLSMDKFVTWVGSLNLYNEVNCMSIYNVLQFNAEPCYYLRHPICEIKLEK